jgi:hypothetical protein
MRTLAVGLLVLQALVVLAWWAVMYLYPGAREPFKATGAPDSAVLGAAVARVRGRGCGAAMRT